MNIYRTTIDSLLGEQSINKVVLHAVRFTYRVYVLVLLCSDHAYINNVKCNEILYVQ